MKPSFTRKHENRRSSRGIRRGRSKKGDRPLCPLEWWCRRREGVWVGDRVVSPLFCAGVGGCSKKGTAWSGFTRETTLSTGTSVNGKIDVRRGQSGLFPFLIPRISETAHQENSALCGSERRDDGANFGQLRFTLRARRKMLFRRHGGAHRQVAEKSRAREFRARRADAPRKYPWATANSRRAK